MKIEFLREILKHYEGKEYDDWEITLFDFNNQRTLKVADGTYASSKETKSITFPVMVEPVDGIAINERIKALLNEIREDAVGLKNTLSDYKEDMDKSAKEALDKINKK
jgi:hypothetical protein